MKIALTFDDGPNPGNPGLTPQFLSVLQKYGVKATFFCIGVNVDALPDVTKQTADAGHLIGNHTYTHPSLPTLDDNAVLEEFNKTNTAIQNATGQTPTYFRPPMGIFDDRVNGLAAQVGLTGPILWTGTADTKDYTGPGVDAIIQTLLSAKDGDVILCHDGVLTSDQTLQAIDQAIPQLQQNGVEFITIAQQAVRGLEKVLRPNPTIVIPHPSVPLLAQQR